MKLAAVIFTARFWLTLMVSITMSIGTAAADIHPPESDDIACQESQAIASHSGDLLSAHTQSFDDPDGKDTPRDHDHHAHSCGSCHLHLVGAKVPTVSASFISVSNLYVGADQTVPRAGPFGLYRPPRA
jgi:hypothetical protein